MAGTAAGGGRFDDGGTEEQDIKIAKYLEPGETVNAEILISTNVRSLNQNFDKLAEFVNRHNGNIKICALQEIWSVQSAPKLPGFAKLIDRQRPNRRGGGVGFYVADSLEIKVINSPFLPGVLETLCLDIKITKKKTIRVLNVYRPPDARVKVLLDEIPNLPITKEHPTFVVGDMNVDITDVRTQGLVQRFLDYELFSIIDIPTRENKRTQTTIDHIYTNMKSARSFVYTTTISDHYTTAATINAKNPKSKTRPETLERPEHNERSFGYLKDYLKAIRKSTMWEEILSCNGIEVFDRFEKILNEALLICCPIVKKNKRKIPINPWMTLELLEMRAQKEKLLRKARQKRTDAAWESFKTYNKEYSKKCREAKTTYYKNEFDKNKYNGRMLWQLANEVTGRPTKKGDKAQVGPIAGCKTDLESATTINKFFATVATDLRSNIKESKKSFLEYLPERPTDSEPPKQLNFHTVGRMKVEEIIENMQPKTSYSHDTMSNKMLKHLKEEISIPLTHLVNVSIIHSYVPPAWKTAKMCPIFKSGDSSQPTNYRPISLLPTMSKVMERVISNQLYGYLDNNRLFYKLQFGFRKQRSCEQLLFKILDYIGNERHENKHVLNIYIDLRKAFDTCNYQVMFKKLEHYGLSVQAVNWFKSYLSDRRMYTRVEGTDSGMEDILCGVPQGSILGPLLFLIYINDLPHATKLFTALYADDTTFAHSHKNMDKLFSEANQLLAEVEDWFNANFLSLHPGKTRFILFSNKKSEHKLYLQNKVIERIQEGGNESSFKLVGVFLDENLSFKYHIKHVHKKIIGLSAMLRRSKNFIPQTMRKTLFHALVQSHLQYCLPIWGGAKRGLLKPLVIAQKRAARIACNVKSNKHSEPCFAKLGALKLEDMYKLACAKIAINYIDGVVTEGLENCLKPEKVRNAAWKLNLDWEPRQTRLKDSNNLKLPNYRPEQLRHLPAYKIPVTWNEEIDNSFKDLNYIQLETALKMHFLNCYEMFFCTKPSCYSCKLMQLAHMNRPELGECYSMDFLVTGYNKT